MSKKKLSDAQTYEQSPDNQIDLSTRPAFHLTPRIGWMNDPNGFSYYNGHYHLFYQYYPYGTYWGPMHWGHAISKDLLHWEYLPAVLAPDQPYDKDGCFSGSAIELSDGRHLIMYTGVEKRPDEDGQLIEHQTQCLAIGDGTNYVKYRNNPVLNERDLPTGCSSVDFRDPKIYQKEDGTYACVIGNRAADGSGQILLFESEDGLDWMFINVLSKNENRYGKMWECPDFFYLDGKWVLLTSPQDMKISEEQYLEYNGTLCLIGEYKESRSVFMDQEAQSIDYGLDYYAPQTILTQDNRRIMIGWMQNWDTCNHRIPELRWFGQMALPREISLKNGRLYQMPIRELDQLRTNKVEYKNVTITEPLQLSGISGRKIDLECELSPLEEDVLYHKFVLHFAEDETHATSLIFRPYENLLTLDRRRSGRARGIIHETSCKLDDTHKGKLKLRIVLDLYSAEVFVNDGEKAMTMVFYTDEKAKGISFEAIGEVSMNITKYDLQ